MLRNAKAEDLSAVEALYSKAYQFTTPDEVSFFFQNRYESSKTIVKWMEDQLVSAISYSYRNLHFLNRVIQVNYVEAFATKPEFRHQNANGIIMEHFLDEAVHESLMTLVKTDNPKIYERYGFQPVYERHRYTIRPEHLVHEIQVYLHEEIDVQALKAVYERYAFHFTGYPTRTMADFSALMEKCNFFGWKVLGVSHDQANLSGYIIYEAQTHKCVVHELVYLDGSSINGLLSKAMEDHIELVVELSKQERIEKIIPLVIPRKVVAYMAKLNNAALFNKLFKTQVQDASEAYALLSKPVHFFD
ncbi:MAG: GNAT family N-acetyltransferase [Erysipelotrichaceae bacterium]